MLDCKVVLDDILSAGSTGKFDALKSNQDKTHSVSSRRATERSYLESLLVKKSLQWPKMDDDDSWNNFDAAVANLLRGKPSVVDRLALLEEAVYSQGSLLFGFSPIKQRQLKGLNRRAQYSISLVKEKNQILSQINSTSDEGQISHLKTLLDFVRARLRVLRRGEYNRKKRWKIKQARVSFNKNPYEAGKKVLDPKCNISLSCSQESLDLHKARTLNDPYFGCPLPPLRGLPPAPDLKSDFVSSSFTREDFFNVIQSRRNGSSPGINKIPYKVYKKCPQISSFLFKIFQSVLKLSNVPIQWRVAAETYIPKIVPPNPSHLQDFRPIALLNVEGKLFFSLIARRLEKHIIKKNNIINTSVQKGCISKLPGCWEHMSLVWEELKLSKSNKSNLSAVWLDIANAYGSIPHQLIFLALQRYGIDPIWIDLIKSYYSGLWSKSFYQNSPSNWHQHQRGIFTGCTVSIILFLSGINVVLEYIFADIKTPTLTSLLSPPVKAFMDDIFLMSSTQSTTQELLNRASFALSWARMTLKASKSRAIAINNGKVCTDPKLVLIQGETEHKIPSITDNPIKFLGRYISSDLNDKCQIKNFSEALSRGLQLIDKSHHRDIHKLWILQHLLIPRLRWPLLIYEIPLSAVVKFEQKISVHIRKWLHIHNSTTDVCLYSSSSPCPLPIKSLTSIWKSSKVSGQLLLRESSDAFISDSDICLRSGNWKVDKAVRDAENKLEFQKILGYHQTHRAGFGSLSIPEVPPKNSHAYRKLLSSLATESDDEKFYAKAVQLSLQGQWVKWCSFIKQDLSWKSLLGLPQSLSSFCIGATYDTLPSPSNLHRWNITTERSCFLCKKSICTTPHVLGACKIALKQGRYTYRHDLVLQVLVTELKSVLTSLESSDITSDVTSTKINFVKEGTIPKKIKRKKTGILYEAADWVLLSDLEKLVIPSFIAVSPLRPDILLYSPSSKRVVLVELTCPCEENMEDWHKTKFYKYDPLSHMMRKNGWSVDLFAVEVGARGYCSLTVKTCLLKLGFQGKLLGKILKRLSTESLKASFEIWLSRDCFDWSRRKTFSPSSSAENPVVKSTYNTMHKRSVKSKSKSEKCTNAPVVDFKRLLPDSKFRKNCGILNKGNTCYLNASLQCLSTMVSFWSTLTTSSTNLSPFASSFTKIMTSLITSKGPIDPSNFIRQFTNILVRSGKQNVDLFQQQDAAEFLSYILDELVSVSPFVSNMIKVSIRVRISCNHCNHDNLREDISTILQVPVKANIQSCVNMFLAPVFLSGDDSIYCHVCESKQPAVVSHNLSSIGKYLILQTKRFVNEGSFFSKHLQKIVCTPNLSVPVLGDNDHISNEKLKLLGTINHSGSLERGHYTSFVKFPNGSSWFHCNDAAVLSANEESINNDTSYIYFYEKI